MTSLKSATSTVRTPDGRSLDVYTAGPADGAVLLFPSGTPSGQGGHDRMVPFAHGEWLAAHVPTAPPRLFTEQGHLTLFVDTMPRILDELLTIDR